MARPRAKELTERELEVMHAFWAQGEMTVAEVKVHLAQQGRDLAYTTVATLVKILSEKGFLDRINEDRPFRFVPLRSFDDVSGNLLLDLVDRVFQGSRSELLQRLMGQKRLSTKERRLLEEILREHRK